MSRKIRYKTMADLARVPHRATAQNFTAKQWNDPSFQREVVDFINDCTTGEWAVMILFVGIVSFYFERDEDAAMFKMRHG